MRALLAFFFILISLDSSGVAQPKPFTISDALGPRFALRGLPNLAWHPDSQRFTYLAHREGVLQLQAQDLEGKTSPLLRWPDLERAMDEAGVKDASPQTLALLSWKDARTLRGQSGTTHLLVHLGDPPRVEVMATIEDAEATTWSKDARHAAFVRGKNVWVLKDGKIPLQVTRDGGPDLTHGVSVSRVEFGINDGLWWDPTGRRVAFYQEDLRPIDPYPYVDLTPRPAAIVEGRYPMAGRAGSRVRVGVFDVASETTSWLATDPSVDEYLTNVTWHPSGDHLLVAHVNRDQDRMDLVSYDAATGKKEKLLFVESDHEWVEPEHGPLFVPDSSGDFLWVSFRDGYRHFWHYRGDGRLVGQVTRGKFDMLSFAGFDPTHKGFFFESTGPNPLERHLFHATLEGQQRAITKGRGQHAAKVSSDGAFVLDVHTNLELPQATDLVRVSDGEVIRRVHEAEDPFKGFERCRDSLFTVKTEEGDDLHGYLVLPPSAEPGRKYPVLQYVYAGPHSQLVTDAWISGPSRWTLWLHAMAQRGYVCFILDGRGTNHRGIEWQQTVFRRLGELETEDQIRGLKAVLARDDTDPHRVGVTGWSYGGFMTLTLMTREPEWYRAGVAGAPVTNWQYYETGYGERYMDTPDENRDGYTDTDPGSRAGNIKGRLLVVHGSRDDTVVWQHTLDFVDRCVEAGAPVDYMVYPGQLHGLRGKAFTHFIQKMTDYFDMHLRDSKGEPAGG